MSQLFWIAMLLVILFTFIRAIHRFEYKSVRAKIERNRHIADFMSTKDIAGRLAMRARPNARIAKAFGIQNSFTTTEVSVHKTFLNHTLSIMRNAKEATWIGVHDRAGRALDAMDLVRNGVKIEPIVRVTCFQVVLYLICNENHQPTIDIENADWITATINRLWLESKEEDAKPLGRREETLSELRSRLQFYSSEESGDPLAIIIPAYETLWRVVLLTYVHVAFRGVDEDIKEAIQDMLRKLDHAEGQYFNDFTVNLSAEALRLYPPTKRIYRASGDRTEAADVESLHRDNRIWGPDALEFRPDRFTDRTQDQRDAYMPFGVGRHVCPASNGFAGKMITLLILSLIRRLGTSDTGARISFNDDALDQDTTAPLPTGRATSRDWMIYPRAVK